MKAPSRIKIETKSANVRPRMRAVEDDQLPRWQLNLVRFRQAESGKNEFSDKRLPALMTTLQRKMIAEEIKKELPAFNSDRAEALKRDPLFFAGSWMLRRRKNMNEEEQAAAAKNYRVPGWLVPVLFINMILGSIIMVIGLPMFLAFMLSSPAH